VARFLAISQVPVSKEAFAARLRWPLGNRSRATL